MPSPASTPRSAILLKATQPMCGCGEELSLMQDASKNFPVRLEATAAYLRSFMTLMLLLTGI